MKRLAALHRRLDALQARLGVRIAVSVLALLACAGTFGSLIVTSVDLDHRRERLIDVLAGENLRDKDEHALSLATTGTIALDGVVYGAEVLAERADLIFDEDGNVGHPQSLAEVLLRDRYPSWAPRWMLEAPGTTALLGAIAAGWLLLVVWMGILVPFLLVGGATVLAAGLAAAGGHERTTWALSAIGTLAFSYVVLTRAFMILYDRPRQILAVAHTVLKEATRTRVPLVFVVLLLIVLPLIPLGLDEATPLRFRVQTFISRSMGTTYYLAACMTLVLACASVAFEIRDRQIWQIVTKPVGRLNYLLGKWLGIVTVNAVIMAIAAVSIFSYIQYQRQLPVAAGLAGQEDAQQVREAVLTARVGRHPAYERLDPGQLRTRIEEHIGRDPELSMREEVTLGERLKIGRDLALAHGAAQRSILPQQDKVFVFENLDAARRGGGMLTLRYRFHILRDDEHETFPATFVFNDDPELAIGRTYVPTMAHVLSVPASWVREDGTLSVRIVNGLDPRQRFTGNGALNWEEEDLELLFRAGSFEGNFLRAVAIDWIKLGFLAMLGISCATFLSFSVACLTSFTIFLAGTVGPFLAVALRDYLPPDASSIDWANVGQVIQWAFQTAIRAVAVGITALLRLFGAFRPTQSLVEGRLIPISAVAWAAIWIGLLWSGLALLVGWATLRRRQLAIYSGQG